MTSNSMPLISIAIATYNRAEILRRSVRSLYHLTTNGLFEYEIVVIDNASTDNTPRVVEECSKESGIIVRHIVEAKPGLPFARNRSVKESRGQWVAFFDDDQLAATDWLVMLYQTALKQSVDCVGGSRSLVFDSESTSEISQYARYLLGEIDSANECFYHIRFLPCTGNVIVNKKLFELVGLFNEDCVEGGEDGDFFLRMLEEGFQGYYQPAAHVHHLISPNRLERNYLEWIAFRHGLHLARRDLDRKGKFNSSVLALSRWLQAAVTTFPRMVWSQLINRSVNVVAMKCKIALIRGYTQYVFKSGSQGLLLSEKSIHRGKG